MIPKGWHELKVDGIFINDDNTQIVITGSPKDTDIDEDNAHNCDAMGCGSLSCVVLRAKVTHYGCPEEINNGSQS
jgi:hypothetical protein